MPSLCLAMKRKGRPRSWRPPDRVYSHSIPACPDTVVSPTNLPLTDNGRVGRDRPARLSRTSDCALTRREQRLGCISAESTPAMFLATSVIRWRSASDLLLSFKASNEQAMNDFLGGRG